MVKNNLTASMEKDAEDKALALFWLEGLRSSLAFGVGNPLSDEWEKFQRPGVQILSHNLGTPCTTLEYAARGGCVRPIEVL